MADSLDTASRAAGERAPMSARPARLTLAALVVLGAFDVGRLLASALIGPWLAQVLLGGPSPVVIGELNISRVGVEVLAIAIGVGLAALIAVPLVRIIARP